MDMNKSEVVGNLSKDVVLETSKQGQPMLRMVILTHRYLKGGKETTEPIKALCFGPLAKYHGELGYLVKGNPVAAVGHLHTYVQTNEDGSSKSEMYLIIDSLSVDKPKNN